MFGTTKGKREVLVEKWFGNIGVWYKHSTTAYSLRLQINNRTFVLYVMKKRSVSHYWKVDILEYEFSDKNSDINNPIGSLLDIYLKPEYYKQKDVNKCQKLALKIAIKLIKSRVI